MRPRVAVVGSVNVDLIGRCERLPRPGETVTGATFHRAGGGKGANQAVAAARLGAHTALYACVGGDRDGDEAIRALRLDRVETGGVRRGAAHTGVALVLVAQDGENQIVVAPGANAELTPDGLDLAGFDAVLCQLEIPLQVVSAAAAEADGLFCLNAAPAMPVPASLLERCDVVVVNRFEASSLDLGRVAGIVALTMGPDGASLLERGVEVARCRPPSVEAVDGTAAGDAFCAALVVSLLEGRERGDALRRACAAGALAASRLGAQPSLPTAADLAAILSA